MQKSIPVILVYVSISKSKGFYYARLQDIVTKKDKIKLDTQKNINVKIPIENNALEDLEPMFNLIKEYYIERE